MKGKGGRGAGLQGRMKEQAEIEALRATNLINYAILNSGRWMSTTLVRRFNWLSHHRADWVTPKHGIGCVPSRTLTCHLPFDTERPESLMRLALPEVVEIGKI
jgi:hypothetical protein